MNSRILTFDVPNPTLERRFELIETYGAALARLVSAYESSAAERQDLLQDIWFAIGARCVACRSRSAKPSRSAWRPAHREIAQVLGISENNVAVRLTRARAELARLIGDPT